MDNFDAFVVGAGPAGSTSAYVMASAGTKVLVFERDRYVAAKNMQGGAFWRPWINDLLPDFWQEAPVERFVDRQARAFFPKKVLSLKQPH